MLSDHIIYEYGEDVLFRISSKLLCNQLDFLGCPNNKSLILKYPIIDSNFNRHFIRGVFDGDGCIFDDRWTIVSGSKSFLLSVKNIIEEECSISVKWSEQNKNRKNKLYSIYIDKSKYLISIYNYLYDDVKLFLPRKYNIFAERLPIYKSICDKKSNLDSLKIMIKNDRKEGLLLKEIAKKYNITIDKAFYHSKGF